MAKVGIPDMEGFLLECPDCGLTREAEEAVAAGRDCPDCGTDLSREGIPREKLERIRYSRTNPEPPGVIPNPHGGHAGLPIGHPDQPYFTAELGRAQATFTKRDEEIRIPYISSRLPGDMSRILDKLCRDLETNWIRFVNLSPPGVMQDYMEQVAEELGQEMPPNHRDLREVLEGFSEEVETWDHLPPGTTTSYEGRDPRECICLVGQWEVDDEQ